MYIIGQEHNIEIINKLENLPNFVIIQGDRHMGKSYFTLYLCNKFKLHYVALNNSVSSVRSLIKDMKPDNNVLYHFKNFDEASMQAKNALLKITEEPIPGNYIVITGGPQIKTLHSRARTILMEPFSNQELKDFMNKYYQDNEIQNKLIICGLNSPAKIQYYKDYANLINLADFAFECVDKITFIKPDNIIEIICRFENRYETIDVVMLFLNMLINIIDYKIKNNNYYSYKYILEILIRGKKDLQREITLKRKMLLYNIFYEIYNTNNKGIS